MVGRWDATKVSNTKEERKEEKREEKGMCERKARKRWRNLSREKKKKEKKISRVGGQLKNNLHKSGVSENHESAHTNTRTHLIVPRVCSFSFFVFVIRARIRHHFRIRERDENAADDDDDDFIIGRRRIFAIIFTIIEEEK